MTDAKQPKRTRKPIALAPHLSRDARKTAALVLEVLAGVQRPDDVARALGITTQRYYALESRAIEGLVKGLEPRGRGPRNRPEKRIFMLEKELTRLRQEVARKGTLIRMAERAMGLSSFPGRPAKETEQGKGKRKRRKTEVRGHRAVRALRREAPPEAPPAVENGRQNQVAV